MKTSALNTLIGSLTFLVTFVGFGLARHGHISWWFLAGVLVWGLILGLTGFSAGWDARR